MWRPVYWQKKTYLFVPDQPFETFFHLKQTQQPHIKSDEILRVSQSLSKLNKKSLVNKPLYIWGCLKPTTEEATEHQFLADLSKELVKTGLQIMSIPDGRPCTVMLILLLKKMFWCIQQTRNFEEVFIPIFLQVADWEVLDGEVLMSM